MLIFLVLAFVAAFACFHIGKHSWKTPTVFNFFGSVCVWAAIFSVGGAFLGSGPWSPGYDESVDLRYYVAAARGLAFAVLFYGGGYLLQRAIAKRNARKGGSN